MTITSASAATAVTPPIEPLVSVSGVGKVYGSRRVLEDVSIEIRPGQVVGLIGPNGAGKTTLIRILSGMSRPTDGSGQALGRPITATGGAVPFLGMMIERPTFIETLSARRNLELLFSIRGNADSACIAEVLRRVGLDPFDRKPVRSYSLGMRQRLSLAQAIGERPALVVLDEPTNGLDPSGILQMRSLIRELAERDGMGVLLASHLLSEVEAVCDHVVLLKGGRVRRTYSPAEERDRAVVVLDVSAEDDAARAAAVTAVTVIERPEPTRLHLAAPDGVPSAVRALVEAGVAIEAIYPDAGGLERAYVEAVSS